MDESLRSSKSSTPTCSTPAEGEVNNHSFTEQEKNCIRFFRTVKLLVAKKRFKNAFRPYDINDVLEQYSAGHADVISKVRSMQLQINSVQFNLNKAIKSLHNVQHKQSIQMTRIDQVLKQINNHVLSLHSTTQSNNRHN